MRTHALIAIAVPLLTIATADARPTERRLHSDTIDASSFLWNDWNKYVENYHPNYVADDDPKTAWVEGAKSSGAGEWLRVQVTPLAHTTRVRLRVRNGYQKSKDLFAANARAKDVTVRLLPSKAQKQATLVDRDGWQEIVIEQTGGELRAVELSVRSVYEGSKYPDLCISDVQVFATSTTPDNPAFEKSKRETLMAWRAARVATAKQFASKKLDVPLYPAYAVTATDFRYDHEWHVGALVTAAQNEPGFAKEWKDALAVAETAVAMRDKLPRAQLSPLSKTKLVEVDGLQQTTLQDVSFEPWFDETALRLPLMGTVAALFADQLRVLETKDKLTPEAFLESKKCTGDVAWVMRPTATKAAEGPSKVQALLLGRCGRIEGREGSYIDHALELMVYDASGRLALVVGDGHVDAYRWEIVDGKPKLAGGRSLLVQGKIIDAKKREPVATK